MHPESYIILLHSLSSEVFVWFPASEMMMMLFAAEIGAVASPMMGSYLAEPNRS
jgi:hypothetical protein